MKLKRFAHILEIVHAIAQLLAAFDGDLVWIIWAIATTRAIYNALGEVDVPSPPWCSWPIRASARALHRGSRERPRGSHANTRDPLEP